MPNSETGKGAESKTNSETGNSAGMAYNPATESRVAQGGPLYQPTVKRE